eukprot:1160858-Pelagomonas_calceolata.AAC.3
MVTDVCSQDHESGGDRCTQVHREAISRKAWLLGQVRMGSEGWLQLRKSGKASSSLQLQLVQKESARGTVSGSIAGLRHQWSSTFH